MFIRKFLLVALLSCHFFGSAIFAQEVDSTLSYFLKDFQFFKPMIANLRTPQNHARFYCADAVDFSNSTKTGKHLFFDPSFGGYFPFLGWKFADIDSNSIPLRTPGVALFLDGAAHLLLDFNTASSDVINADYRIGGGIAGRFNWLTFLAFRYRFFHESTHIGDEYTLFASLQPGFRRYNISYEAHEIYLSIDHYVTKQRPIKFLNKNVSYMRAYAGTRFLSKDSYDGFTGLFESANPIILTGKNEHQLGGEIFFRGKPAPDELSNDPWLSRLFSFQYVVFAVDLGFQDKYDISLEPSRVWSTNIVLGLVYGENFRIDRGRTVRWQLNYYSGINPHGQFRNKKIRYIGLDYIIDF